MSNVIDYGTATYEGRTYRLTEEASHSCNPNPGHENDWHAFGVAEDGRRVRITWSFSDAEIEAAGEDASSLPWDDEHVWDVRSIA